MTYEKTKKCWHLTFHGIDGRNERYRRSVYLEIKFESKLFVLCDYIVVRWTENKCFWISLGSWCNWRSTHNIMLRWWARMGGGIAKDFTSARSKCELTNHLSMQLWNLWHIKYEFTTVCVVNGDVVTVNQLILRDETFEVRSAWPSCVTLHPSSTMCRSNMFSGEFITTSSICFL